MLRLYDNSPTTETAPIFDIIPADICSCPTEAISVYPRHLGIWLTIDEGTSPCYNDVNKKKAVKEKPSRT